MKQTVLAVRHAALSKTEWQLRGACTINALTAASDWRAFEYKLWALGDVSHVAAISITREVQHQILMRCLIWV